MEIFTCVRWNSQSLFLIVQLLCGFVPIHYFLEFGHVILT